MKHRTAIDTEEMRIAIEDMEYALAMKNLTDKQRDTRIAFIVRFQEILADLNEQVAA